MIKKIVLDLDDTLNSCTMHILNKLGCKVGAFDYHKFPIECGYDMIGAWSKLTNQDPVDVSIFWEWISRKIWETMPPSKELPVILNKSFKLIKKTENILVATSPTKAADCLFAKYQWIEKHLPPELHRQYSITPRKHWLSQPGVLLLDDCEKNIEDFIKYGGHGILIPRPWNSLHNIGIDSDKTIQYINDEFDKYESK